MNLGKETETLEFKKTTGELREAMISISSILNKHGVGAVYNSNTYHEICIHPDKITIYSPGTFASTYSPEDYISKNLPSSIRNVSISKILYLNKSIEQFGSGFKRINSLCKDANVKYSYEISENGFMFVFFRKTQTAASQNDMMESIFIESVTENVTENVTLNKTEQSVYSLLVKNPYYTRKELGNATSKTVRTIQRTLDSLRKKGLVERIGSDRSGYWRVKEKI